MKHIILGTAGHVDHGKTTLVKALTGIDTDRLKEEKERGITIELGFASLALSDGRTIGVVDVPGHERFIKNMVAGAGGIDVVMMVIAADEGVMPQTREHLHICSLLGIRTGFVVLTKTDLVDSSWLELVMEDVVDFLRGTFLESCPIVAVSVVDGTGIAECLETLEMIASRIEEGEDSGVFRLPVDRVFTMRGFGTVVTGTLLSGRLRMGEEVVIMPGTAMAKVRGIQVYNKPVGEALAGQRTAVNLQGVDRAVVFRGDVLAHPHSLESSRRLDVRIHYLVEAGKKLKNRSPVRLHVGTSEIIARVVFIDREALTPGEECYAQLVLEAPAVVMAKDRFVLRSYSPMTTIGGGVVLDPQGVKTRRSPTLPAGCAVLDRGGERERIGVVVERTGLAGVTGGQLVARTAIPEATLQGILEEMGRERKIVHLDDQGSRFIAASVYRGIQEQILRETKAYHERYPLKEGLRKEELRTTLGRFVSMRLFNKAMKELESRGHLVIDRENVRLAGHSVDLDEELGKMRQDIEETYVASGLTPPYTRDVIGRFPKERTKAESVVGVLVQEGILVKISEDFYYHRDVIGNLRDEYRALLIREGKAGPSDFRELTGLSRKYVIPLMEYFDVAKLTIREGEHRILRNSER